VRHRQTFRRVPKTPSVRGVCQEQMDADARCIYQSFMSAILTLV
jgi:hypothetical protein